MARKRRNRGIQRYPRNARSAAYRIRPRSHPASGQSGQAEHAAGSPPIKGVHTQRLPSQPHDPEPEQEQPPETDFEVQETSPAEETGYLQPDADAQTEDQLPEDAELEDYVEKIEQAAARRRAEEQGMAPAPPRRARAATAEAGAPTETQRGQRVVRQRTPARRRRREKKPLLKRKKFWFIILAMIPLIAGIVAVLYFANVLRLGILAYDDIHEPPVTDRSRWQINAAGTPEPVPSSQAAGMVSDWSGDEPMNIVLMGIDPRPGEEAPPRSDTVIVVHVNPAEKSAVMMSIPRDVLVYIPGFGDRKINAAYPLGESNENEIPGGGPTLVAQTVEANFGIPIDYYATVNFEGFRTIVDTLGGVIVDVEAPLNDNMYPTEGFGVTRVYFHTGLQKLDGEAALRYVRTRHADSDLQRGNRQRQVLLAMREQALDLGLISKAPELIDDMSDTVRTDLNFDQMLDLANLSREIEPGDIHQINLWEAGVLEEHFPEDGDDQYALIPDWPAVHDLLAEPFGIQPSQTADQEADETQQSQPAPTPNFSVPVIVENATDIPQLAGSTAQILAEAGYTAVWPSDAEEPTATTTIYNYTGEPGTARKIAEQLGLPQSVIVEDTGGNGIVIRLGEDVPNSLLPDEAERQ